MASRASCVASSAAAGAIRAHNRRTYGASSSRSWSSASASPCWAAATFAGSTAGRLAGNLPGAPRHFFCQDAIKRGLSCGTRPDRRRRGRYRAYRRDRGSRAWPAASSLPRHILSQAGVPAHCRVRSGPTPGRMQFTWTGRGGRGSRAGASRRPSRRRRGCQPCPGRRPRPVASRAQRGHRRAARRGGGRGTVPAWLLRHVDAKTAKAIIGLSFHRHLRPRPRRLSAAFARQRLRRALAGGARYVAGGWSTLVGLLAERAVSIGAQIRTRTRVAALPTGQTILATSLATARQLTGDRSLTWPSARVATFDLGLRADAGPGWFRVMDLDDRIYAARYSLADPTLAPPGHELIQIAAACAPASGKPTPNAECSVFSTSPGPAGAPRCSGTAAPCAPTAPGP